MHQPSGVLLDDVLAETTPGENRQAQAIAPRPYQFVSGGPASLGSVCTIPQLRGQSRDLCKFLSHILKPLGRLLRRRFRFRDTVC